MNCRKCGTELPEDSMFCPECGAKKPFKKKAGKKMVIVVLIICIIAVGAAGAWKYFTSSETEKTEVRNESQNGNAEEETEEDAEEEAEDDEEIADVYEITPTDADEYFEENATVESSYDVRQSSGVQSESEARENLNERGFEEAIVSEYNMDGKYEEKEISGYSSDKHPVYRTKYVTQAGEIWDIYLIKDALYAYPISYNMQSGNGAVIISETSGMISYDGASNRFYETKPNEDVLKIKTVPLIDAQTLEILTSEEIGRQ